MKKPSCLFVVLVFVMLLPLGVRSQSDSQRRSALFDAVRWDKADETRRLIQQGEDVNQTNAYGQTPLHEAAIFACTNSLLVLLESGARTEIYDAAGNCPLHSAIMTTCPDGVRPPVAREQTVRILLKHGANPNAAKRLSSIRDTTADSHVGQRPVPYPNKGTAPLSLARSNGFTNIVGLLLEHGAHDGKTQVLPAGNSPAHAGSGTPER